MINPRVATLLHRSQLQPLERALFRRWYAHWGQDFEEYEFSHRFGPPALPIEGLPDPIRFWAETVSRLRADFIARRNGEWYIFEIKPIAKAAAVGQLHAYKFYWPQEFPDRPTPRLAIITELVPEYMREVFAREGIIVFEV